MRGRFTALLLALAVAAPSVAQEAKVASGPTLGEQIHKALAGDGTKPEAIGALLRDAINSLGGICLNAQSYQIFRRTNDADTLKVECADRPLYLLSIDDKAHMLLSGGDSRVQAMDHDDGDIVQTGAVRASSSSVQTVSPSRGNGSFKLPGQDNDSIPGISTPDQSAAASVKKDAPKGVDDIDPRGWTRWLFSGLLATFGLVAFLGYSQLAHSARFARGIARVGTYTSDEKDKMLSESAELKPDFYIHPSGLFIVRGKRGKRRLFPNRLYAYLYWRYGFKIAQIR